MYKYHMSSTVLSKSLYSVYLGTSGKTRKEDNLGSGHVARLFMARDEVRGN